MPVAPEILADLLAPGATLDALPEDFDALGARYSGKVRENFDTGAERLIVVTDRISAFDVVLGSIPLKGQVLNRLAAWWFAQTKDTFANHVIDVPDAQAMRVVRCDPLPVEFVVREYLTGVTSTSIWRAYEQGARTFCGHALADGLRRHDRLAQPILTPSTKAPKGGHDESVAPSELIARGLVDAATYESLEARCLALFARGREIARQRGLILADTKYELGRRPDGEIVVIDEIHTPDSSRYWFVDDYDAAMSAGRDPRSFDKEHVRRWYAARGYTGDGPPPAMTDEIRRGAAERYVETFETLTAETFVPSLESPLPRLRRALGLAPH